MDGKRFDGLAVLLATRSRRGALRLLAGGVAGGLLGLLGMEEVAARCRRGKKRCGDQCIPDSACCVNPRRGRWVRNGARYRQCGYCCGGSLCGGIDLCLDVDPDGCSTCDLDTWRCYPMEDGGRCMEACGTCQGGLCEPEGRFRECNGRCVDTQTDKGNCGGCGIFCDSDGDCIEGVCRCRTPGNHPCKYEDIAGNIGYHCCISDHACCPFRPYPSPSCCPSGARCGCEGAPGLCCAE